MRWRILLSYLALISLTVVSLIFIVRQRTSQTFSRYLSDQSMTHSRMLPGMLSSYFLENKTWDGVQKGIDEASMLIGSPVILADAQGQVVAATQRSLIGQSVQDDPTLVDTIPVTDNQGTTLGTVYVTRNLVQRRADQAFLDDITSALLITGLLVALAALGLGAFLAQSISRPLAAMAGAAARVAKGDYGVRVPPSGGREITALAQAFNQMAESVGGLEQVRRELVANVSHDLRTPLTVIRGYLEGLRHDQIADRRSAEIAFDAMYAEVTRLLRLVEDLRQVASQDAAVLPMDCRPTAISDLFYDAVRRITPFADAKDVKLIDEVPSDLPSVLVDPDQMGQVLFNLLENGVNYTPAGGSIVLRAGSAETTAWLAVQDTGIGIAPQHIPHIFERFYRADQSRSRQSASGIGLGLAIVRAIVEAHRGHVTVASDGIPGHGSTFTIYLPLANL